MGFINHMRYLHAGARCRSSYQRTAPVDTIWRTSERVEVRLPKILDPLTGTGFLIGPFQQNEAQLLADAINGKVSGCKGSSP